MATMDYSKLKNAELESLLKERSLPHGGKKADMVARLVEHDKNNTSAPAGAGATPSTAASSEPAAAAMAAGGATRAPNPVAVPNQVMGEDATASSDLSATKDVSTSAAGPVGDAAGEDAAKPAVDFSSGMEATNVDTELEKRKARAKKFGMQESDSDAVKAMERAKRFGTGTESEQKAGANSAVKGLDQALPERAQKKRGRDGGGAYDEDGLRRKKGGIGGKGQREGGRASWMSEKDREAAEKRKGRFG